jgi:hypothetical protein
MLIAFIEEEVKKLLLAQSKGVQQTGTIFPHGLPTNSTPDFASMPELPPTSMSEVAIEQALPF